MICSAVTKVDGSGGRISGVLVTGVKVEEKRYDLYDNNLMWLLWKMV